MIKDVTHIYYDTTFKVIPALYYQLFTVFVPYADTAFPVFYALMTCKTVPAYHAVFHKLKELVPQFTTESTMANFLKMHQRQLFVLFMATCMWWDAGFIMALADLKNTWLVILRNSCLNKNLPTCLTAIMLSFRRRRIISAPTDAGQTCAVVDKSHQHQSLTLL